MKKFWIIFGWTLTLVGQIFLSLALVEVLNKLLVSSTITTVKEFIFIPLNIWLGFLIGVFSLGILSLLIRKIEPYHIIQRFFSTLALSGIPIILLFYLGLTVGVDNQTEFQEIVLERMVPYYTQLNIIFSLLGFYLPSWFKKLISKNKQN